MATTKATTLAHTLGGISGSIETAEINRLDGVNADIQTQLDNLNTAKAPKASPAFTGTPTGLTKNHVGLGNVDNVADASQTSLGVVSDYVEISGSNATNYTISSGNARFGRAKFTGIAHNTATSILSGYGGSLALVKTNNSNSGHNIQQTFLVTHSWTSESVLFSQYYGCLYTVTTFSASSGVLKISHNRTNGIIYATVTSLLNAHS